ncbi:hypothetical protein L1987_39794 [Smallanthus sonchifolius]|uniref:Uncharacterized protein n=1 Tax=Smallanthus sonchifolius TaxID=185202 RepID=A0ACB9HP57_9ASTR|nr:hypothetical protein L1987_39794 [Smallanthus sonchifolius]
MVNVQKLSVLYSPTIPWLYLTSSSEPDMLDIISNLLFVMMILLQSTVDGLIPSMLLGWLLDWKLMHGEGEVPQSLQCHEADVLSVSSKEDGNMLKTVHY